MEWRVYDHDPHDQMSLLDRITTGCQDITAEHIQGWTKRFSPRCMVCDDIRCDVDENLWPIAQERSDQPADAQARAPQFMFFQLVCFSVYSEEICDAF